MDSDASPRYTDDDENKHGTEVAGSIAASANNVCGVGLAYNASIGALKILDGAATDLIEVCGLFCTEPPPSL